MRKAAQIGGGCPFCSIPASERVAENEHALARRDLFPLTEGHTLVIPREHVASLFDLPAGAQQAVWRLVAEVRGRLLRMEGVEGVNVGLNDGEAAGQTLHHAHVHLIPRRRGDVPDPRGGIRWIIPERARYWEDEG